MSFPSDLSRDSTSPEHLQLKAGQRVFNKRYELIEKVGSGGMGVVWLAQDRTEKTAVALKFLPSILVHHPKEMDRLREEVRIGKELRHDLIVATYGLEVEGPLAAIVLEFVQGETLKQKLEACERGFFEPQEIEPWLENIVSALTYLHGEKQRLHRDLKPANLIVGPDGHARLMDFGISQTLQETMSRHTQTGAAQGTSNTLAYASPESLGLRHKPAVTDDIYSLGATLYELLTGTPPFYLGTPAIIALHIETKAPPSVMQRREELVQDGMNNTVGQPVDARWQAMLDACLAKDPAQRQQSVKAIDWREAKVVESFSSRVEASDRAGQESPLPCEAARMRSDAPPKPAARPAERHGLKPGTTLASRLAKGFSIAAVGVLAAYAFWPRPSVPETPKEVIVIKEVPVKDAETERKLQEEKQKREEAERKLADSQKPKPAPTPPAQPKPPRAEIVKEPSLIERLSTQGNSLGMKFIHFGDLPDQSKVLGCMHETRTRDYAAFMASGDYKMEGSEADNWKTYEYNGWPVGRGKSGDEADITQSTHPVCCVNHNDAKAFCDWLTKKERAQGLIGPKDVYRLPTDHEWSLMVGIGDKEDPRATPESKDDAEALKDIYPWGRGYPPPKDKLGNYADATAKAAGTDFLFSIPGYDDGYATTAPVMSYPANKLGFHDLGGNLWEWCEDWYDGNKGEQKYRVLRGASWIADDGSRARSSDRNRNEPMYRNGDIGFRCVLVVVGG